jgi:hypothetical protein
VKTTLGEVRVIRQKAQKIGLKSHQRVSPVLEKCCWLLAANEAYIRAEEDLEILTGIKVGHTTIHRIVNKAEIPEAQAKDLVKSLSVDGGKICLRSESGGKGQWRDYKMVSLHQSVCRAEFQENETLVQWSNQQRLATIINCIGDGHPGVWNLVGEIAQEYRRREILDWFHLSENLYKVGGSLKRLKRLEAYLWQGLGSEAIAELSGLKSDKVDNFVEYLGKHRARIPDYQLYQELGLDIGSGSVESKIKQMGNRVKITGAQWKPENIPQILRLRCAYLNGNISLSICA